jgi:hypothetical protein
MVMLYALRIFICKSDVSGFTPTYQKHHSKQKFHFGLEVDDSAGNTLIFSLVLQVTQGGNRF